MGVAAFGYSHIRDENNIRKKIVNLDEVNIIKRIESSIKSTMSYIGCKNVNELRNIEKEIIYLKQSSGVMTETSIRGKII
jgi:cell fate (sporulation/competence/biofilm development) regulator YmcA (YheA/YmcA/DUF963 family)